jgi:ABC-type transporter Mla MlaB component
MQTGTTAMLRIFQTRSLKGERLILCGQLAGPWVDELRHQWYSSQGGKRIVDLTDVTFVDEAGEALLRQMKEQGAELVTGGGVATRDLLRNLRTGGCRPVRRLLGRNDET